jgi:histidinol-phosphate aminotransferase
MTSANLPLRPELRGLSAYGAPQLDVAVRLNTNENPFPIDPAVADQIATAVATTVPTLNRYPDREATDLRTALADYLGHGLSADRVWAANGSNEVLQQVLQAFGGQGRSAMGYEPSYSMHRLISVGTGTSWMAVARNADFSLDSLVACDAVDRVQPDVVFICSPNNPTGTTTSHEVIAAVYDAAPGMVVVDEAYQEFASRPSALELLAGRPRLVVTRTMSKAFALAGARVGYLAADPAVVEALRLVRLPYHLSALTQAVAVAALRYRDVLLASCGDVIDQRDRIVTHLRDLGLTVCDSDANFVLFGEFPDQSTVWQALLDAGVLVRDVGLPGWLRVTAGTPAEVGRFLTAIEEVIDG